MSQITVLRSILLCIAALLLCQGLFGAGKNRDGEIYLEPGTVYRITEKWYFKPDDRMEYADPAIGLDGWILRRVNDPTPWREFPSLSDEGSLAWYRINVSVSRPEETAMFLYPHKRGAQIYLNGELVTETRPFLPDGSTPPIIGKPEMIRLSSCHLLRGMNVIAIRTGSLDGWGGFMNDIYIGQLRALKHRWMGYTIWHISISFIGLFLFLFFFMHFYQRKMELYNIHYSLMCLGLCLWSLGFSGLALYILDYQAVFILCSYVGALSVGIFYTLFMHSFFNIKKGVVAWIFVAFYTFHIVFVAGEFVFTGRILTYNSYLYDLFINSILLLNIYILAINIRAVKLGLDNAWQILAGNIVYMISLTYSILVFLSIIYSDPIVMEGFFTMNIIFVYSLANRYARVHRELEKAHNELLVLDSMKDDFLAMTSHEIRTPLHGIMGIAETLLNGRNQVRETGQREQISLILDGAERLNELVGEILDFSKLRAEKVDLYLQSVELDKTILSVTSLMEGIAENKNIVIQTDIERGLPPIYADRKRIEQVLINIVGNAVKYTDQGRIVVSASQHDERVVVTVEDTGRGIEDDRLSRIWNPYEQGGDPDTSNTGGTGLGLPIAKYLVELHGGTIGAESYPGRGSTFYVEFPLTLSEGLSGIARAEYGGDLNENGSIMHGHGSVPALPDMPDRTGRNTQEQILVVDDDPMNLLLLNNFLSDQGYRVITAETGPECLKFIEAQRPNLVILDLMLPGMSGYDVMKQIRDRYVNEFIPVIMVTAKNQTEDMIKGFLFGCNDFLNKPFNLRELLMRVQNQLVLRNLLVLEREFSSNLAQEKEKLEMSVVDRSRVLRDNVKKLSNWESVIVEDLKFSLTFLEKLMINHVESDSLEYSVHYDPLLQIGGDVYSVYEYREGRVRVFLADATGHGINASLNSITIMTEYNLMRDLDLSPGEIVSRMNNRFCTGLRDYSIIFTCCIADIDLNEGTMVLASAGHPAQFCFTPDGSMHECIPKGPLIGLMDELEYEEMRIDFPAGSTMVMYTDGLVDEFSESRSYTGKEKRKFRDDQYFREVLRKFHSMGNTDKMSAQIKTDMKGKYRKLRKDDDDITLIILRRKG